VENVLGAIVIAQYIVAGWKPFLSFESYYKERNVRNTEPKKSAAFIGNDE